MVVPKRANRLSASRRAFAAITSSHRGAVSVSALASRDDPDRGNTMSPLGPKRTSASPPIDVCFLGISGHHSDSLVVENLIQR
jgi:hypothetical protein